MCHFWIVFKLLFFFFSLWVVFSCLFVCLENYSWRPVSCHCCIKHNTNVLSSSSGLVEFFFFSGNSRVPVSLPFPASRSCLSSYLCFCHHIFFCFFYYIREIIPSMCNTTAVNLEIWTTEIVFEVVDKVSIFNQKYLHVIIVILLVEEILENVIWTESDDSRCKAWDTRGND